MPATKYSLVGSSTARNALIFLHGHRQGGLSLRGSLCAVLSDGDLEAVDTCIYCFTASQTVDDDGEQPEWFAYRTSDRLSFVADDMLRSRQRLHLLVSRLQKRHGKRGGTVSLGGYSQGACMAIDVALTQPGITHCMLVAGFCMLPRFVTAVGAWHGYKPSASKGATPRLSLWAVHGRRDSEITWALGRRSYEAVCELYAQGGGGSVTLERVELGEDDDHWSIWDAAEMGGWILDFCRAATAAPMSTARRRLPASATKCTSSSRLAGETDENAPQHQNG